MIDWTAWLREGIHGQVIRAGRERLLAGSHRAFVSSVYQALLWRGPDAEGQRHFVQGLSRGTFTREQVIRDVGQSREHARHVLWGPGFREYVRSVALARSAVDADLRPICFLHPMKCGGTALSHGLSSLIPAWPRILDVWIDQLVCLPQPMLQQAMLVTGHLPHSAVRLLAPNTATCTVLREPIDRTLSHLAHLRTHGGQPKLTLEEFIGADEWRPAWVNYQARQLAADVPAEEAWEGTYHGTLQALVDTPEAIDEATLAARAGERLDAIDLLGVSDDLDAVLRQAAELWRRPSPEPLRRSNASEQRVQAADVPERLLAEIRRGTVVDAELYARARDRVAG